MTTKELGLGGEEQAQEESNHDQGETMGRRALYFLGDRAGTDVTRQCRRAKKDEKRVPARRVS